MSRTHQPLASTPTQTRESSTARTPATLRLRGEDLEVNATRDPSPPRHIRWSEDVIDNEGMGKKSSKVCCIYHKSRPVGESSSESESSDSSSSDSDTDSDSAGPHRTGRANHPRGKRPPERHSSEEPVNGSSDACCPQHHKEKNRRRKPSPNAYEKMPKTSKSHSQGT